MVLDVREKNPTFNTGFVTALPDGGAYVRHYKNCTIYIHDVNLKTEFKGLLCPLFSRSIFNIYSSICSIADLFHAIKVNASGFAEPPLYSSTSDFSPMLLQNDDMYAVHYNDTIDRVDTLNGSVLDSFNYRGYRVRDATLLPVYKHTSS